MLEKLVLDGSDSGSVPFVREPYRIRTKRTISPIVRCIHLRDKVDAFGRGVGYELRHPDALLCGEVEVYVVSPVPLELSEHFA